MKYLLILLIIILAIILVAAFKIYRFVKKITSPLNSMKNNVNNVDMQQQFKQEQLNDEVLYSKDNITVLKGEAKQKK